MLIYIAGPYSADTGTDIESNVLQATLIGQQLMRLGHSVICPHSMTHKWDEDSGLSYRDFMRQCLDLLKRCDAIYLLPGWENSDGSRLEFHKARKKHIPAYYKLDDVPEATK